MYGEGAKYNTMEHKFRGWRKKAENLRVTAGEGTPQRQPQTTPRTTRTLTSGGRKTDSSSNKKTAKASKAIDPMDNAETDAVEDTLDILDIFGDDASPIKPEIKLENDLTRDLMGIKSYAAEDSDVDANFEIDDMEEHISKRVKLELDIDDTPAKLPSIDLEREMHIDSQANGYDLSLPSAAVTAVDVHGNVLANLDTLVRGSGAYDSVFEGEA